MQNKNTPNSDNENTPLIVRVVYQFIYLLFDRLMLNILYFDLMVICISDGLVRCQVDWIDLLSFWICGDRFATNL